MKNRLLINSKLQTGSAQKAEFQVWGKHQGQFLTKLSTKVKLTQDIEKLVW